MASCVAIVTESLLADLQIVFQFFNCGSLGREMSLTASCGACKRDIVGPKFVCSVCTNLYLCLECIATGTEAREGAHVASHAYRWVVG